MDHTDAIAALIETLKTVTAQRAELFARGTWTREEMEKANDKITAVQADIKRLKAA